MMLALLGYSLCALAFAILGLLCITSWRGKAVGALLALACGLTALWSGVLAAWIAGAPLTPVQLYLAEVARNIAWLVFLARMLPGDTWASVGGLVRLAVYGGAVLAVAGTLLVDSPTSARVALIPLGLASAVLGLVLLEQILRNTRPENRWSVKYLLVGVGGIFAYDLFLYSHATLFREIQGDLWGARGFANVLMVPVLAIAARRNPRLSVDLFVSRQVTFYTAALMGAGIYLLAMAAAGYAIRMAGGTWGTALQVVFLFGAVVVLALVLLSGNLRARMKVFIAKHFYANKYDYREEWLDLTASLDTLEPDLDERCIQALARIVGAGGGSLWLRRDASDGEPLWERAGTWRAAGGPERLGPDDPLIRFVSETEWSVHVGGYRSNPSAYAGFAPPEWLLDFGRDALAVPLLRGRALYGVMVLSDPRPGLVLDYEEIDLLKIAGRQVATALAQARTSRMLTESRQFEAYNRLTAFLMHDLKNLIAQQSLVVRNAAKHKHQPAFVDDAIDTIDNSVQRMQRLLDQLERGTGQERREAVRLPELVRGVVAAHADRQPAPTLNTDGVPLRVCADPDRFGMIIGHVIRNAQDATPAEGRVAVDVRREGDSAVIEVADNGAGMTPDFLRDRLFKPFDSTKGARGMGIGAYQVRQFVEDAGGEVRVESRPSEGTRFELRLPVADATREGGPVSVPADNGTLKEGNAVSG